MPDHCYFNEGDINYPSSSLDYLRIHKYKFTVDFNVHPRDTLVSLGKNNIEDWNMTIINS